MDHSSLLPQPPPEEEELDLPSSHPARRSEFGGKNETKRGWGESMELAHQQDNKHTKSNNSMSSVVAVDLGQFRNTEVGKGYQAKHVVRQKMATTTKTKTRTVNDDFNVRKRLQSETATTPIDTNELLKNDGLRAFRKEIESILSSS